jgi:hypothetical protein
MKIARRITMKHTMQRARDLEISYEVDLVKRSVAPGPEHFQTLVNGVLNSFTKKLGLDSRMLPTLDNNDLDVLRMFNDPREISRTARMMVEKKLVSDRRKTLRN